MIGFWNAPTHLCRANSGPEVWSFEKGDCYWKTKLWNRKLDFDLEIWEIQQCIQTNTIQYVGDIYQASHDATSYTPDQGQKYETENYNLKVKQKFWILKKNNNKLKKKGLHLKT